MSYRLCYGSDSKRKRKCVGYFGLIGVTLIVAVWISVFRYALPQQAQKFREVFLPWSSTEVRAAVVNLRTEVQNGISIQEAVQTFCTALMYDAEK